MIYKNNINSSLNTFFIWQDVNHKWYIHVSKDIQNEFNNLKVDEKFPNHWETLPFSDEVIDTKSKLEEFRDHWQKRTDNALLKIKEDAKKFVQEKQNEEVAEQIIREELVEHYLSGKENAASKFLKMKEKELDRLEQEHYQKEFQRSLSFSSPLGLFSLISLVLFLFLIFGPELS